MLLSLSDRLHYCACSYLSLVGEAEALLEEQSDAAKYYEHAEQWFNWCNDFGEWLATETHYLHSLASNWGSVFDALNNHIYVLITRWSEELVTTAQAFTSRAPALSVGTWLYYLYGSWHHRCLETFDMLLHEPIMRQTPWFNRYEAQVAKLTTLIERRQQDRPILATLPTAQQLAVIGVQEDLERRTAELAREWYEAVVWAAVHLPWEQLESPRDNQPSEPEDDSIPY